MLCNGLFKDNIIELKQEEIANIIGSSRIQVARVLQWLRENNIIKTYRNSVEILNIQKLKEMCSVDVLSE